MIELAIFVWILAVETAADVRYCDLEATHQPDQLISLASCVRTLNPSGHAIQLHLAGGNTHQLFLEFLLLLLSPSGSFLCPGPTLQLYRDLI